MTCPTCDHDGKARAPRSVIGRALRWYDRTVWRLGPACPVTLGVGETMTGLAEPCGCDHAFHVAGT